MSLDSELLQKARELFLNLLGEDISTDEYREDLSQLRIKLTSGLILYIRYNEFGEYAYQIIFSPKKDDFSRFDNFDDRWDVSTKPHHFHEKGVDNVKISPMNGDPDHDMPLLVRYIIKGTFSSESEE